MFIAMIFIIYLFIFCVLMPLSAIFQLYHGDQFQWWKKPEYPERNTDHGQTTGKLYHLRLRVECTLFCNLQTRARTHAILVIHVGLHELLGNPTTYIANSLSHPGPRFLLNWFKIKLSLLRAAQNKQILFNTITSSNLI